MNITDLIQERDEAKHLVRELDHKLADEVMKFEGTLLEALQAGLVRLNFSAPAGFYNHISKYNK